MTEAEVRNKYEAITKLLILKKKTITTMESCTSGQVASLLTDTEGASAIMKGAFITYSNEAKIMQGVPKETIENFGVYSLETAEAMAGASQIAFGADFSVGVTGSFGNVDPANKDTVQGEVFFAIASKEGIKSFHCSIPQQGSRFDYKLYMADLIADELIKVIS